MVSSTSLNNFVVDQNGRTSVSGISSGIDFQAAIESIIAARRIPIDRLEANVTENTDKIGAFTELRTLLNTFKSATDSLRGKVSFGNAGNIFESKEAFATTSRTDATTPSASGNLMGVSVTNAAAADSHTIEILQVATAHKFSTLTANSSTADLGTAFGQTANSIFGTFEINGRQIDVQSTDSLVDLADRINTANSGSSATGVTASIVSASSNEFLLVLTADATGQAVSVTDSSQESVLVADDTAQLDAYTTVTGAGNTFEIRDAANTLLGTVIYNNTDSLNDLQATIDAISGITATVVAEGASFRLNITADNGTSIKVVNDTNNVVADLGLDNNILNDLGISSDFGTTFTTELRVAQNAKVKADSLLDPAAFQASGVATALTAYNVAGTLDIVTPNAGTISIAVVVGDTPTSLAAKIDADPDLAAAGIKGSVETDTAGLFHFEIRRHNIDVTDAGKVLDARPTLATDPLNIADNLVFAFDDNTAIATIPVAVGDSLSAIAANINGDADLTNAGISADVVASGSTFKLQINYNTALTVTSPDSADVNLGLANPDLVIERDSNTISDLFGGLTLSLFQSEVGTTVKLDIELSLGGVKSAVIDLVDSYNAIKAFINLQQQVDATTGTKGAEAGPLFGNSALANIEQALGRTVGGTSTGIASGLLVLAQIGVNFVDNDALIDPLSADSLEIDEAVLDAALLDDPDGVRKLFAFEFSSSDPRVGLLNFTGTTAYKSGGYTLDITHDGTAVTAATFDSVASSTTFSGNSITASDQTGANGLQLLYTGTTSASNITIDFTIGLGAQLFFEIDRLLDEVTGPLENEVNTLTDQNTLADARIAEMEARLVTQRERLLQQFTAMEVALAQLKSIQDSIKSQFDALNSN